MTAEDGDAGDFGIIKYSLSSLDEDGGIELPFYIDPNTGEISLMKVSNLLYKIYALLWKFVNILKFCPLKMCVAE